MVTGGINARLFQKAVQLNEASTIYDAANELELFG
jgi:hypothetical protein